MPVKPFTPATGRESTVVSRVAAHTADFGWPVLVRSRALAPSSCTRRTMLLAATLFVSDWVGLAGLVTRTGTAAWLVSLMPLIAPELVCRATALGCAGATTTLPRGVVSPLL